MPEPVSQVMADIAAGDSLTLDQAADLTPAYRGKGKATRGRFWRYIRQGFRCKDGRIVHLEAVQLGRQILTSKAALARFTAAINGTGPDASSPPAPPTKRTPAERRKAGEAAAKRLAEAGA